MHASKELQDNWHNNKGYGDLVALAKVTGLQKSGLSQIMNGKRGTTRAKLAKIEKWVNNNLVS